MDPGSETAGAYFFLTRFTPLKPTNDIWTVKITPNNVEVVRKAGVYSALFIYRITLNEEPTLYETFSGKHPPQKIILFNLGSDSAIELDAYTWYRGGRVFLSLPNFTITRDLDAVSPPKDDIGQFESALGHCNLY